MVAKNNSENEIKIIPREEFQLKIRQIMKNEKWNELEDQIKSLIEGVGEFKFILKKEFSIIDKYFDNKDLDLFYHSASFRIRELSNSTQLNIKTLTSNLNGVFNRKEFEYDIDAAELRILQNDGVAPQHKELQDILGFCKSKIFKNKIIINNQRVVWQIEKEHINYELCIDRYNFESPNAWFARPSAELCEIEIEAKNEAAIAHIKPFGESILKSLLVSPSRESKYQQGIKHFNIHKNYYLKNFFSGLTNSKKVGFILAVISLLLAIIFWVLPFNKIWEN